MCVDVYTRHSLGCILAQLLVPHEELLSLPECFADGVSLVNSLDGGSSDVLDGCYGQSAMLQHELSHLTVPPQQSIVQGCVPSQHKQSVISGSVFPFTSPHVYAFMRSTLLSSPLLCVLHVVREGIVAQQQFHSIQVAIVT